MNNWLEDAKKMEGDITTWRRHLHQNPEVGMDIPNTAAFVEQQLQNMGYETKRVGGTGVVALAGGKKPGKVILLRADMDALPFREEADVPFRSENGYMHACGHDLHTAMLLGAARLLKDREDEIEGTIKLMFQPAEETLEGAKAMVADGVLQNPTVDAAVMIHVAAGLPVPAGMVLVPHGGTLSAASDWFEVHITGKGGHGAMPEATIDPLNVAAHTHIALQELVAREIPPSASAVVTVGKMAGGTTSNVIPETAELAGTVRTFDPAVRALILQRIPEIAAGVAQTFRAKGEGLITEGCPSVVVDDALAATVFDVLNQTLGDQHVPAAAREQMRQMNGSEDFSFVTQEVPSLMMGLTAGSPQYGQHHPKVCFDESILPIGAVAYAAAGFGWLQQQAGK